MKLKVNLTIDITDEDIDDIMDAAFHDGICYWCNKAVANEPLLGELTSEQISRGGSITLHDAESDDTFVLTKEKLFGGLKMTIEEGYDIICGTQLDTDEIDAEIADIIIQYALFGEIVFG